MPKRDPFEKPKFVDAMQHVIKHETDRYVDHPGHGGETKYGITKKIYPDKDIKRLKQKEALEIYEKDYWNTIQGEKLPRQTAKTVMDSAVLSGQPTAVRMLQTTVGEEPDGRMGPRTLQAILNYTAEHGDERLAKQFNQKRIERLKRIKGAKKFQRGWVKRVKDLEE